MATDLSFVVLVLTLTTVGGVAGVRVAFIGAGVAVVAADGITAIKLDRGPENIPGAVRLRAGEDGAPVVSAMTSLALGGVAVNEVMMIVYPVLIDGVHAMRAAIQVGAGGSHGDVAGGAFDHHATVALESDVAQVVIGVRAGELGVRGAVAGRALQAAVADGETIEGKVECGIRSGRRVGRGREG